MSFTDTNPLATALAPEPVRTETITVTEPPVVPARDGNGRFAPTATSTPPAQQGFAAGQADGQTFTAADIERVKKEAEEQFKATILSPLQQELDAFRASQKAAEDAAEVARLAAEEETRKQREEAMSAKELMEQIRAESAAQIAALQQAQQESLAVLAKERQFSQLSEYRSAKLTEAEADIHPSLRDFVTGNSVEEIDRSIELAKNKTDQIISEFTTHFQQQRRDAPGVAPTGAPPIGPMETVGATRTFTAQDIANMSMEEYARYRPQLVGAASQKVRNSGLYG